MMMPFREWAAVHFPEKILWFHPRDMVECYQCMGVWCGWFCGIALAVAVKCITPEFSYVALGIIAFLCGFASSYLSSLAGYVISALDTASIIEVSKIKDK